jgi:copper(I)-binding protein
MFVIGDLGGWAAVRSSRAVRLGLAAGVLFALLGPGRVSLASTVPGRLAIERPWCLSAAAAANAAGYLVVDNKTYISDRLTAITSPAAQRVSIHQSRVAKGLATMVALDGVEIPARTAVTFAPGGLHLMLEAVRRPFVVGERVPVILWFKVAGPIRANLVVTLRPPGSAAAPSMRM